MIHLTRLNNSKFIVNSDLIKFVEQSPDTVITLLNGEKILVQELANEVVKRVVEFRRQVIAGFQSWDAARSAALTIACEYSASHKESEG